MAERTDPRLRPARQITTEEEGVRPHRHPVDGMSTLVRSPVEVEPVGTYIVGVYEIVGYQPDCDGGLLAILRQVDRHGAPTGLEARGVRLDGDSDLVVDRPADLWVEDGARG